MEKYLHRTADPHGSRSPPVGDEARIDRRDSDYLGPMGELLEKYVTVMARLSPVVSKYPPVVQANPTSQIVPEFSGKDRFFDVSTGGARKQIEGSNGQTIFSNSNLLWMW